MKDLAARKERYMRDPLQVRLGGLAANLARIKSFSGNHEHGEAVESLLQESRWLIEWAAPEAKLEVQVLLVDIQRHLARLLRSWRSTWKDPQKRSAVAQQSGNW
jgi:hypothetical protein